MLSSSRRRALAAAIVAAAASAGARAQQKAEGFAVDRLYLSAPGGGWMVLDSLDLHGALGGSLSLTFGYARNPLRPSSGPQQLAVVSDLAVADVGAAVTFDRVRLYLNFASPLAIFGQSGTVGGYSFSGPSVDLGMNPDKLSDLRIGFDARIFGEPTGRFRVGAGAQLFFANGSRADYDSDNTTRAMGRVLFAGDEGAVAWAGHLGVHLRPLDDTPVPGSPRGSELLFGFGAGPKFFVGASREWVAVIGPEVFGATAFRDPFASGSTALEGLLSGRVEGTAEDQLQYRFKFGAGAGMIPQFGAPQWRVVLGFEIFTRDQKTSSAAPSR